MSTKENTSEKGLWEGQGRGLQFKENHQIPTAEIKPTSHRWDVEPLERSCAAGGHIVGPTENCLAASPEAKATATLGPNRYTPGYILNKCVHTFTKRHGLGIPECS